MRIVFIHYHLKTGGVTTVIKQQLRAIQADCEALIITGEPPVGHFPGNFIHIPGIAYAGTTNMDEPPEHTAESILKAIRAKWKNGCDIIHVHNPLLKKNGHFLKILKSLQQSGLTLFLQQHDFAEDGRPTAYFREPYIADCHYGVINSRDYRILLKAGLKANGLHLLANEVNDIPFRKIPRPTENLVVYPVRAIRRKNVGEAILLSLFFKNTARLGITLPPNSPVDIRTYDRWKRFSKEFHLPVSFDVGVKHDFSELISASHFLISTSISEGFGFSFLEPWTAKKLLWGRDLPDVTADFKKIGIGLNQLYQQLRVPLSIEHKERFSIQWKTCVADNCRLFGLPVDRSVLDKAFDHMTADNCVDFGLLNESFQKQIIEKTLSSKNNKAMILAINPFLACPGRVHNAEALVEKNREAIQRHFSRSIYRKNLMNVYHTVCRQPVAHQIDKTILLNSFFNLDNFSLLKWGNDVI
jgi:hypothetical protein